MEAAHGAIRTQGTYLVAQYRRLAAWRGKKRALVAVAHSILTIIYYVLKRREPIASQAAIASTNVTAKQLSVVL